jgi:selenocysteine-specific elongation factor
MRVVGTAGHVDHGKSTLVLALTGINPDRLKEEQERQMTIDLGFAWMNLPDGETVGIVDVPGHRDFIENMLAGVGGMDAVLFVVAADEGVMPQTREHLAILDILQVHGGVIVLTKCDLVDDPEWLELVKLDVRQVVQGTILSDAPMVTVSAFTGVGLDELVKVLSQLLAVTPERLDLYRPRLPVDRVFTLPGFGTVVTGTLVDGGLQTGEEVVILPDGLHGRIRGLQAHKNKVEHIAPGSRTAVNITGINHEQIRRGDVLAYPGTYQPTQRIDARFKLAADASLALKHNSSVKLFIGAAEVNARVRLLGSEDLLPGSEGWLQLELERPVVAVRGDHYLLRRPSPGETLGGGVVVDANPPKRHKRFDENILQHLLILAEGTPTELLLRASLSLGPASLQDVITHSHLPEELALHTLNELADSGKVIRLGRSAKNSESDVQIIARQTWDEMISKAVQEVQGYLKSYPLRQGIPREQLKSRLKLSSRFFNSLVAKAVDDHLLVETDTRLSMPGYDIKLSAAQQAAIVRVLDRFTAAPFSPPSISECQAEIGDELLNYLVAAGRLVQVSPEVVYRSEEYNRILADLRQLLKIKPTLTVAEFRDHFQTSRRYALAFLEHLDEVGVTVREGDNRRLAT